MDIVQEIKKDHQEVKTILQKLMSSKGQTREKEFSELKKELVPHLKAEETILYKALLQGQSKQHTLEGYEEHRASEMVLKELEKTSMDDERWSAKLKVLSDMIEHHIKEEESKTLKTAQSELKDKLAEMGEEFDSKKQQLRKQIK